MVLKNIEELKNLGVMVTAQLTINSENTDQVVEVFKKLTNLGVSITWSLFRPNSIEQMKQMCQKEKIINGLNRIYEDTYIRIKNNKFYGNITDFDYLGVGVVKDGVCGASKSYIVLDYNGDVYSCTEKIKKEYKDNNILNSKENVFDLISRIHDVPQKDRFTENFDTDYKFKWQSGMGCPWVVEKEKGEYGKVSDYMTGVYEKVFPLLASLNVLQSNT